MDENFGVHRRREDRPTIFELATQLTGVGQISIVCKPDVTVAKAGQQPSRASGGNDYQIRYKVEYQGR